MKKYIPILILIFMTGFACKDAVFTGKNAALDQKESEDLRPDFRQDLEVVLYEDGDIYYTPDGEKLYHDKKREVVADDGSIRPRPPGYIPETGRVKRPGVTPIQPDDGGVDLDDVKRNDLIADNGSLDFEKHKHICANHPNLRTTTFEVHYPRKRSTCEWGRSPNLGPRDGFIRAQSIENKVLNEFPSDLYLCSMGIETRTHFEYDDAFLMAINSYVLAASSTVYANRLTKSDGLYVYNFLEMRDMRNVDGPSPTYCLGGDPSCKIPDHISGYASGPMNLKIIGDETLSLSEKLGAGVAPTLGVIILGDDDRSDCTHSEIPLKFTVSGYPVK